MTVIQFAIAIVFPGATPTDIVKAALRYEVHILNQENYEATTDYTVYDTKYGSFMNGSRLYLLFIFPGNSILANDDRKLQEAMLELKKLSNE